MITKDAYEKIWSNISNYAKEYLKNYATAMEFNVHAKHLIIEKYRNYLEECKTKYMSNGNGTDEIICDRHKVAAAFMIAIMKGSPIVVKTEIRYSDPDTKWFFNEQIAIKIGISVLCAYIAKDIDKACANEKLPAQERVFYDKYLEHIENDFTLPDGEHGTYMSAWEKELYYNNKNNNLNVLDLASKIYLLEKYNELLVHYGVLLDGVMVNANQDVIDVN